MATQSDVTITLPNAVCHAIRCARHYVTVLKTVCRYTKSNKILLVAYLIANLYSNKNNQFVRLLTSGVHEDPGPNVRWLLTRHWIRKNKSIMNYSSHNLHQYSSAFDLASAFGVIFKQEMDKTKLCEKLPWNDGTMK